MNHNYCGPKIDIQSEDLSKYEDKGWVLEPKIDGMWVEFTVQSNKNKPQHSFLSRKNITPETIYTKELSQIVLPLPEGTVLCGELEAGTDRATQAYKAKGYYSLYLFDIIKLGSMYVTNLNFKERRQTLETVFKEIEFCTMHLPGRFNLVPCMPNLFQSRHEHIINTGGEGSILKRLDAKYQSGKTEDIIRCKAHLTDDFVLMGIESTAGGDLTGTWGQYFNGKLQYVMRAQPKDMKLLNPNNFGKLVAEFKGWGRQSSGTLRSAQFIRARDDKDPEDCVLKKAV